MSVEITLDVEGAEEFKQATERFDREMQNQVRVQLAEWAGGVETEAKRLVPVRTGYLRSTIFSRVQEWTAVVGAEAAYAANVEFGTRYAGAQPFLRPAVETRWPELERLLSAAVGLAKAEAGL
jgi:HK97 gp10 family phage protein